MYIYITLTKYIQVLYKKKLKLFNKKKGLKERIHVHQEKDNNVKISLLPCFLNQCSSSQISETYSVTINN